MKRMLVLLMLVAACGGGSGDKAASAKSTYLAAAEAICAGVNTKVTAAKKEQPTAIADIPPYVHRILLLGHSTYDELSKLTPPPADAAEIKAKIISPLATQLAAGDAFAAAVDAAAAKKDTAKLTSLVFNPPTKTSVDLAWMKTYGFSECLKAANTGASSK
jgi:hypothetical protein